MTMPYFQYKVRLAPKDIDFLNRIFEAYDHLALVSTIDAKEAVVLIRGYGQSSLVRRILRHLPIELEWQNLNEIEESGE